MGNSVVHFEIMGKDADGLRRFYREAFDWQIAPPIAGSPVDYALVQRNEAGASASASAAVSAKPQSATRGT